MPVTYFDDLLVYFQLNMLQLLQNCILFRDFHDSYKAPFDSLVFYLTTLN